MRVPFPLLMSLALVLAACQSDSPVQPSTRASLSLRVNMQQAPAGSTVEVQIFGVSSGQDLPPITLFDGSFPVTTGLQQVPITFDLTPCLALNAPDANGPFCPIGVFGILRGAQGDTLALSSSGQTYLARPGQVTQASPIYLVTGNSPPVLDSVSSAIEVESGLLRFQLGGSDPDGDLSFIDINADAGATGVSVLTTTALPLPAASFSGTAFALGQENQGPFIASITLYDTKFNNSGLDNTTEVSPAILDYGLVDTLTTSLTADSLVMTFTDVIGVADSAEVVVRNRLPADQALGDSIYFVCGGRFSDPAAARVACGRTVPFASASVIVVPINANGQPGKGLFCDVPGSCTQPVYATFRRQRGARHP
ncbi:MAG: hypothetical protein ACREOJ_12610 [Gemmatimonadaceae bacterium]